MNASNSNNENPHVVLVPHLAQGHIIPMLDIAHLLADRGVLVSFITTPVNAARIKPVIARAASHIKFIELNFPCEEAGLPQGCENVDLIPSVDLQKPFIQALSLLQQPLQLYLHQVNPAPTCMITDYINSWTEPISLELNIPRFIFHGPSCFYLLCMHNIRKHNLFDGIVDEFKRMPVPGLPGRIQVSRAQAPGWFPKPDWDDLRRRIFEAEASADGVVINTFHDLEPDILKSYRAAIAKPVWAIGPLSLCSKDGIARGDKTTVDESRLVSWLDSMQPKSVVFISFGTLVSPGPLQLIEIGRGLEACNQPFVWVVQDVEKQPELGKWLMSDGFEERVKGRGLVIRGWAPQVVILSHPSVGGFLTHCGWNSTLEGISAGLPMLTWPHFADQFVIEKFVVEVVKIGVSIGVELPHYYEKDESVSVKKEEIERAVLCLMDGGREAEDRRKRAAELAEMAKKAIEDRGSSTEDMTEFVQYIRQNAK